jgi:hypothetical protein
MVKKKLADGSDCRKCGEVTEFLQARGLWNRIDEVIWAQEGDPTSPGMVLGERLGVARAPFFVVRDENGEKVYTSVLRLVEDRLGEALTTQDQAGTIDPDDVF